MAELGYFKDGNTEGTNVNIVDSDIPTNKVKVTDDQKLTNVDIINGEGVQASLTIGTTAVEVKVGATPIDNRKEVTLYNNSNNTIYWGFTSAVTTATGTPVEKKEFISWRVGPNVSVFVIAATMGNDSRITEAS